MTQMNGKVAYALEKRLDLPYEEAVAQVTAALKVEGFGVLTEIDVQQTLKKKLDVDFRRYVILGACNPALAHRAFEAELLIGTLLPCNVVVFEDEAGGSVVSAVNPLAMMDVAENEALRPVGEEAAQRLERALAKL